MMKNEQEMIYYKIRSSEAVITNNIGHFAILCYV